MKLGINRALVAGVGKVTGKAVVDALLSEAVDVTVYEADGERHASAIRQIQSLGVEVIVGDPDVSLLEKADVLVPSPGVPPTHPLITGAIENGIPVWSEIELGSKFFDGTLIAVTGTNGKTTVTELLTAVLSAQGHRATACGNIGFPFVEAARGSSVDEILVCEASSAQLSFTEEFQPSMALVLNVADDHYDWHSGYEAYVDAKSRITAAQQSKDDLVIRADDRGCARIASKSVARTSGFGPFDPDVVRRSLTRDLARNLSSVAGIRDDAVWIENELGSSRVMDVSKIRLIGLHNVENVLAVSVAASAFGVSSETIAKSAGDYGPKPHRTEFVREVGGVRYVNDSKATNPHATLSALEGLDRVILIAGGRAKGLDLSVLARASSRIKSVILMGEAAAQLGEVFSSVPSRVVGDVEEAVKAAAILAAPGDTVLLSPACASQDQYADYVERGDRFAAAVKHL